MSIHSIMLVALGFLGAALLGLFIAPAYYRRTVRLTTEAIKRSMPLTEAEIRADKDRLRAEFAITIHRLETRVQEANLAAARQMVELNRRDAAISDLEGKLGELNRSLEEHENARSVLEQTVTDRLPKVEGRLNEAKRMLFQRDREISTLTQSAERQSRAIEEATQINTQQRDEIHRLNAALAARAARNRENLGDARFDAEVALRSEIEALRAKSRDQANHITRLQGLVTRRGGVPPADPADAALLKPIDDEAASLAAGIADDGELAALRQALSEAEKALRLARDTGQGAQSANANLEQQLRALETQRDDMKAEVSRLKAALTAFEGGDDSGASESRIALKAQVSSHKAQAEEQTRTIQRLRAELAASNERLARQAQSFRDEMRRLGAGTLQTSAGDVHSAPSLRSRRSLSARINEPRSPRAGAGQEPDSGRVSGFLKALDGTGSSLLPANGTSHDDVSNGDAEAIGAAAAAGMVTGASFSMADKTERLDKAPAADAPASTPEATPSPAAEAAASTEPKRRRPRLMERITGLDKSSA